MAGVETMWELHTLIVMNSWLNPVQVLLPISVRLLPMEPLLSLTLLSFNNILRPGADPEIEEGGGGGGHTYRVGIGAARVGRSCVCAR